MAITHKTMRGSAVNMDQIRLKNEKTIAIGNMNVNAAGDEIGPGGKIIKTSTQRIKEQNTLHTMVPDDLPVQTGTAAVQQQEVQEQILSAKVQAEIADQKAAEQILADAEQKQESAKRTTKPKGGLAATLADKKEVKHTAIDPTPATKKKKGVKRI